MDSIKMKTGGSPGLLIAGKNEQLIDAVITSEVPDSRTGYWDLTWAAFQADMLIIDAGMDDFGGNQPTAEMTHRTPSNRDIYATAERRADGWYLMSFTTGTPSWGASSVNSFWFTSPGHRALNTVRVRVDR